MKTKKCRNNDSFVLFLQALMAFDFSPSPQLNTGVNPEDGANYRGNLYY